MIKELPIGFGLYRKKSLVVKAIQMKRDFEVETLEGPLKGHVGDYLIEGIKGEVYPCRKDVFEQTYDKVSSEKRFVFFEGKEVFNHKKEMLGRFSFKHWRFHPQWIFEPDSDVFFSAGCLRDILKELEERNKQKVIK